jgi:hypothetical protein
MKRIIVISAALLLLAAGAGGDARAATLKVQPSHATFIGADHQTLDFVATDAIDMLGVSVTVQFDPAVVTPVGLLPGDGITGAPCSFFFQWVNQGSFVNTIQLDMAFLGCTDDVTGSLFSIEFAGVADGTSPIDIIELDLRDGDNQPIQAEAINGSLTYLAEVLSTLSFQPENVFFEEDGTCQICLNLSNVADFLGMSVEFAYDPAIIEPVAVAPGPVLLGAGCPFFLDWVNEGSAGGTVVVDMALLGCHGPVDGDMVCITFQGVAYGTTPLTWGDVFVRDGLNAEVPVNLQPGEVNYNPAVAVTPVTFDGLKARYQH